MRCIKWINIKQRHFINNYYNTNMTNKSCFPYTYGDEVKNDGDRCSDSVVRLIKNKNFQNYMSALAAAVFCLSSYAQPAGAVPADAGEGIANLAEQFNPGLDVPVGNGHVQRHINVNAREAVNGKLNNPNPLPVGPAVEPNLGPRLNQPNYGWNYDGRMGGPLPVNNNNHFHIPGPPKTTVGKSINTLGIAAGVTLICLNGYWGNPLYATICAGIVFDLAQGLVKKTILK